MSQIFDMNWETPSLFRLQQIQLQWLDLSKQLLLNTLFNEDINTFCFNYTIREKGMATYLEFSQQGHK